MTIVSERALYQIRDVMAALGMSRSVVYEQIRSGRLQTVTQGRRRYVTAAALARYVGLLEHEARNGDDAP